MKLKRVEPDSCTNCIYCNPDRHYEFIEYFCKKYDGKVITMTDYHEIDKIICADGYEDNGSRNIN